MKHFSLVVTFITRQSVFHLEQGERKKERSKRMSSGTVVAGLMAHPREPDVPLIYPLLSSSNSDTPKANTDRLLMKSREKTIDTRCAMLRLSAGEKLAEEEKMVGE
jgi:hypothetical protein